MTHLKVSHFESLLFVTYANYTLLSNNRVKKLEASPVMLFNYDTGEIVRHAMLPNFNIA